jgi:hypothetical protein
MRRPLICTLGLDISRLAPAILAATVVLCAVLPGMAQAGTTVATIKPSFAPDRLGAVTAVTMSVHFSNEQGGVPAALSHAVVQLPPGLGIDPRGVGTCSKASLEANLGRNCPASALIGSGSALAVAHLGSLNLNENTTLSAWRGPNQGGHPTLEIAGEGLSPLQERVVASGVLEPDHAPYGQKLVMSIPPIPTIPLEPDASIQRFSVTIGFSARTRREGHLSVPRTCPAGGFPFAAEFTYADGSSSNSAAKVPCP